MKKTEQAGGPECLFGREDEIEDKMGIRKVAKSRIEVGGLMEHLDGFFFFRSSFKSDGETVCCSPAFGN